MGRATKPDTIRQAEPLRELTEAQELAIGALIAGQSDADAGQAAGVTRQTVNGWKNHDALFVARLNAERAALWEHSSDKLRALVGDAIQVLAEGLDGPDYRTRQAAAVHILRATGLYSGGLAPTGSADPERVELQWQSAKVSSNERFLAMLG